MAQINRFQSLLTLLLIAFIFTSATSFAGSLKDQMMARLPALNELKESGVIGENNQGLLVVRQAGKNSETLVQEENTDRQKVYIAIAVKQGATATFVGQRRAVQIAEIANPGTWLQDQSGNWYQK